VPVDNIGHIPVPTLLATGTFPIKSEYPHGRAHEPELAIHRFASRDAKTEQRFLLGNGVVKFTIKRAMPRTERIAFVTFWRNNQGANGQFTYNAPNLDGTTTAYTCRFADPQLTLESAASLIATVGITIVGVPTTTPTYSLTSTVTRFPTSGVTTSLLDQVQTIIPLLKITVLDPAYPAIFLSDRRVTIGSQTWYPRLLEWDGIQQSLGGGADQARFSLGNADRVMSKLVNDCDLFGATIEFSLFHVNTTTKIDLWAGNCQNWRFDRGPVFTLAAADGVYELALPYPVRKVSRVCDKVFNSAVSGCPYSTAGNGTGDPSVCDKSFRGTKGCVNHGMEKYFRAVEAQPQGVRVLDNSTGVFGFGRNAFTSTSIVADTVYDQVVPEVWTHTTNPDPSKGLVVNAKIIAGRDEGDFYAALGIVSEGPISEFGGVSWFSHPPVAGDVPTTGYYPPAAILGPKVTLPAGVSVTTPFTLDGQPNHGWPANDYGLRLSYGDDPAAPNRPSAASDKFSLGAGGGGVQTYSDVKAAGLAFAEIRRSDEKGLQPSQPTTHSMQVVVRGGMSGWVWSAPGTRTKTASVNNPVWVLINIFLRARGLWDASNTQQEAAFDVQAAIDAAAVCNTSVTPLFGTGTETQFVFSGVFQEEKPLRDWMQEVCNGFLGYFVFSFGRLKVGVRNNSSVVSAGAFTDGNILFNSLSLEPAAPEFNHLTGHFGDEEFDYAANSVQIYDIDHALYLSRTNRALPQFLRKSMSFVGVSTKSRAGRIITTRLREELGGVNADQRLAARNLSFGTTVLALGTEVGQVCSLTHEDMPTYPVTNVSVGDPNFQFAQANYGEFRIVGWKLNKDYSIEINGRSTHNDMYNMVAGDKPADATADPVPIAIQYAPGTFDFSADATGSGALTLSNLSCAANSDGATQGVIETYYADGPAAVRCTLVGGINSSATTGLAYSGPAPVPGEWVRIGDELLEVLTTTPGAGASGTFTVARGALGTTAAAHARVTATVTAVNTAWSSELTVATGLTIAAGSLATAGGGSAAITEYNATTGKLRLALPIPGVAAGSTLTIDPRIWNITKRTDSLVLPYRFFSSAARATFTYDIVQPHAIVALVRGRLENATGLSSDWAAQFFAPALWTAGGAKFVMPYSGLTSGSLTDAFNPIEADEGGLFARAYADVSSGATGPVSAPAAPTSASPGDLAGNASIAVTAGPTAGADQLQVSVSGALNYTVPPWSSSEHPGITTAAAVATSLKDWLNGDATFSLYYSTTDLGGGNLSIQDLTGNGGTLAVARTGAIAATASGFTSALNITSGRFYAVAFATGSYRSELSPWGPSSGPTSAAQRIEVSGLPVSSDPRVTTVEIYASLDGLQAFPRLVGTVVNGVSHFTDTTTEAARASCTPYPGANQPAGTGDIKVTLTKDGAAWCELFIPSGAARSNVVAGEALDPIAAGSFINANIDSSSSSPVDLRVVLD
jgi:hypothetical protein